MPKPPVGVYQNKGSKAYYFSSSLNIDPNITYRNRIFGFKSIKEAYKAKKEYERKVSAIKELILLAYDKSYIDEVLENLLAI